MNEQQRNQIVQRWQAGLSQRQIAKQLGMSRKTVQRVLRQVAAERTGQVPASNLPKPARRRPSLLDAHVGFIRQLLERYPNMTAVRVWEELRARGFRGSYSIVRDHVGRVRPSPAVDPVIRFETAPGQQAQMDYSTYTIDFTEEGRRRVHLFSYILSWSRRQYLRFVESQDLVTTLRQHVQAFRHLGGVAAQCLYDNMKVVVLQHDADGPVYNPRFLAFATHYGFKPWACRPRRAKTKGKVERPFHYAETSLLNGRTFRTLEHLNEVTVWWLANVADVRIHRETQARPLDRHAEERPHLLPLPAHDYHVCPVVYRVVDVEGFISYQQNWYSVPWRFIGQTVPVQITETEVVVHAPNLEEIARHLLFPRHVRGQRRVDSRHRPRDDSRQDETLLRERFAELGPVARRFLDSLLRDRYGKSQARKVLSLLGIYARKDLVAALERAVRFGACSSAAIVRILAVQARPRSVLDTLAEEERRSWPALLTDNQVSPRPLSEYQQLLDETNHDPPQQPPTEAEPPETRAAGPA